uniref:Multidrug and toxin extrusion protein n=1 Tax=Schmidtea mediterranea TaxID=79327 RepID=A0A0H3YKK5_SCHMD|nr:slc47a-6 [Schmidtea mediterranea]
MNKKTKLRYENLEHQPQKNNEEFVKKLSDIPEETTDPPVSCISRPFLNEAKLNIKIAFPVMITNIFQYSLTIETTSFAGRLTATELEGVGLALSLVGALGWCICTGMVSACDTMFAQSFGSTDKKRTGLFLQRGLLLTNLIPIFLWSLHINLEPLLILCGQDRQISRVAGEFMTCFTPGITFMMNYLLLARYMQDQGCLWPPVIAGICGNVFNICFQLLFVTYLQFGFKSAALCHAFSFGIMTLVEALYIWKSKFYLNTWPGFQLEAFYDWFPMLKLGLAGMGHTTFEVLVWEASVFMGGLLGTVQVATQSIMIQILYISFMLYYGCGIASNIRVGQCLGANRPNQAKQAYRAGIFNTAISTIILATSIILLRYQIPLVFTNKKEVLEMTIDTMPYIFVILYCDPFSGVCSGTLRGCARQLSGCMIIFVSFYMISLPVSIVASFVYDLGVKGIWIGPTCGCIVAVSSIFLLLECQDWKNQAYLAQRRIFSKLADIENDETEKLIYSLEIDNIAENGPDSHIRTPSHPIMCSTEIFDTSAPRTNLEKSIIWKRVAIFGCAILFLLCGIFIHLFVPLELYRGTNFTLNQF